MAILTYAHHRGRAMCLGSFLWMVTCSPWRCEWHLCGVWPTMRNSQAKVLRMRQCRTWSTPKESKVPQVCAPISPTASFPSETETGTRLRRTRRRSTWCVVALALALRKSQKILWLPFSSLKYSPHQGAWHPIRTLCGFLRSPLSTTSGSKSSLILIFQRTLTKLPVTLPKVILVIRDARARIQILVCAGTWSNCLT